VQLGEPTKLPGPDTIDAVAVFGPASIVPPTAFTVIVNTWFEPIGFAAVAGAMLMFASTNVFTASGPSGATPSVCTVNGAEPPTESVAVACPVTVPAVGDVNVIVHCPFASVFAPAPVQLPVGAVCAAPPASASVTSTCSPAAGTNPFPSPTSFSSVTVNVWG
jgi:hypothetical protein